MSEILSRVIGGTRAKVWAILDGCPTEYRSIFEDNFSSRDLEFIETSGIGNRATFIKQVEVLLLQSQAEHVYFAEDDYVYAKGQFPFLIQFLQAYTDADFVTPYDHPDCYTLLLHREPKWLRLFESHHWRTAASTCLTFLTRRTTLAEYSRVFRTYGRRNNDCGLWLSMTKRRATNPLLPLRCLFRGDPHLKILAKAWVYCWRQIVFGRRATLWTPVPGIATHLCNGLLSPGVDWVGIITDLQRKFEESGVRVSSSDSPLKALR